MHGRPLSKYDNRLLWETYSYWDLGIIGEPYFDVDFSKVLYLTDTGRRWDGFDFSVRDKVKMRRSDLGTKGLRDEETERLKNKVGSKKYVENRKIVRKQIGRLEERKEILSSDIELMNNRGNLTLNEKLGLRFRGTQDIIDAAEAGLLPDRIMITVHPILNGV